MPAVASGIGHLGDEMELNWNGVVFWSGVSILTFNFFGIVGLGIFLTLLGAYLCWRMGDN